jgi:hypothetical protein
MTHVPGRHLSHVREHKQWAVAAERTEPAAHGTATRPRPSSSASASASSSSAAATATIAAPWRILMATAVSASTEVSVAIATVAAAILTASTHPASCVVNMAPAIDVSSLPHRRHGATG